eukprot:tig00000553_g2115.t1
MGLGGLPDSVVIEVLRHLGPLDLLRIGSSSRELRRIVFAHAELWCWSRGGAIAPFVSCADQRIPAAAYAAAVRALLEYRGATGETGLRLLIPRAVYAKKLDVVSLVEGARPDALAIDASPACDVEELAEWAISGAGGLLGFELSTGGRSASCGAPLAAPGGGAPFRLGRLVLCGVFLPPALFCGLARGEVCPSLLEFEAALHVPLSESLTAALEGLLPPPDLDKPPPLLSLTLRHGRIQWSEAGEPLPSSALVLQMADLRLLLDRLPRLERLHVGAEELEGYEDGGELARLSVKIDAGPGELLRMAAEGRAAPLRALRVLDADAEAEPDAGGCELSGAAALEELELRSRLVPPALRVAACPVLRTLRVAVRPRFSPAQGELFRAIGLPSGRVEACPALRDLELPLHALSFGGGPVPPLARLHAGSLPAEAPWAILEEVDAAVPHAAAPLAAAAPRLRTAALCVDSPLCSSLELEAPLLARLRLFSSVSAAGSALRACRLAARRLESLALASCPFLDAPWLSALPCAALTSLSLSHCPRLAGTLALGPAPRLRSLRIAACRALSRLELDGCPALQSLRLEACPALAALRLGPACRRPRLAASGLAPGFAAEGPAGALEASEDPEESDSEPEP